MMITVAIVTGTCLIVFVSMGISLRRFMRKAEQHDAELQALPRTPIKDLVAGSRVRIVGIAHGSDLVKAPHSGTRCIAVRTESSAAVRHGDGSTGWTERFNAPTVHEIRPFFINDGTGNIAVEIEHVTLDLDLVPVSNAQIQANVFGAKMIARESSSTSYKEWRLAQDSPAGVIGTVGTASDGTLRIVGTVESPIVISNRRAALG